MKQRSGFTVMFRLIGLVRPLAGYMLTAVGLGVAGFVCSTFLTVLGAWSLWNLLAENGQSVGLFLGLIALFGVLRGFLRYGEQACNHYIAFKLLALIRDKIFTALRRLCPAKLEGRDKGDLISVITSDIELLEVFYAHTISPVLIALLMCGGMSIWLGSFHPLLGLTAAVSYVLVGSGASADCGKARRRYCFALSQSKRRIERFYAGQSARAFANLAVSRWSKPFKRIERAKRCLNRAGGKDEASNGLRQRLC